MGPALRLYRQASPRTPSCCSHRPVMADTAMVAQSPGSQRSSPATSSAQILCPRSSRRDRGAVLFLNASIQLLAVVTFGTPTEISAPFFSVSLQIHLPVLCRFMKHKHSNHSPSIKWWWGGVQGKRRSPDRSDRMLENIECEGGGGGGTGSNAFIYSQVSARGARGALQVP